MENPPRQREKTNKSQREEIERETRTSLDNLQEELQEEALSPENINESVEKAVKRNTVEIEDKQKLEEDNETDEIDKNILSERDKNKVEKAAKDNNKLELFESLVFLAIAKLAKEKIKNIGKFLDEKNIAPGDSNKEDLYYTPLELFNTISGSKSRSLEKIGEETEEERKSREEIVKKAYGIIGSEDFRGPEVAGGRLACAQVVSRILKETGAIDKEHLAVADTIETLKSSTPAWKEHSGPPRPGDVIVWNRTTRRSNDGNVVMGHAHIGIAVTNTLAVSNSSSQAAPRMHPIGLNEEDGYWHRRGVAKILSPPPAEHIA